jgi:hypothetical protein
MKQLEVAFVTNYNYFFKSHQEFLKDFGIEIFSSLQK